MARIMITGKETQKMQEYTQEQIDRAEHMGIAIPADVKEQIFEYANLIGEEEKVRTLVRSLTDAINQADEDRVEKLLDDAKMDIQDLPDPTIGKLELRDYGYTAEDMVPLRKEAALDYHRMGSKIYCLGSDGSKGEYMKRCMQNDLAETAWSATQYLWKLHPIFNWIEDKAGVFYKRSEVPVLGLTNSIGVEEILFIVAGLIPNRKSTTVVDEWFGLLYKNGQFDCILSMSEVLQKTHLNVKVPNTQNVSEEQIARGQKLLGDVVDRVKKIMADKCAEYKEKTDPYIYEEMERLEQLEQRHKDAQLTIFDLGIPGMERKKSEKEREIEAIFTNFMDWEKDTLEIEENPYIRIIAVVTGVI